MEAGLWVEKYGEALKTTYLKEMERLFAQLTELSRRLERPLKDLDDIKGAIDILRKTRDLELDMDDAIDPIEVRLAMLWWQSPIILFICSNTLTCEFNLFHDRVHYSIYLYVYMSEFFFAYWN